MTTGTPTAMDQQAQDRLTKEVGRALVRATGPGWSTIRAEYRSVGRHIEVDVAVTVNNGDPTPIRPPAEAVEGLRRLRAGMYRPDRGTWIAAVYEIEAPGTFTVDFDANTEPVWRRVPPPIGFQDELRFFPRADENIPDWWRARAGMPPAGAKEPEGPSGAPSGPPHPTTPPRAYPPPPPPPPLPPQGSGPRPLPPGQRPQWTPGPDAPQRQWSPPPPPPPHPNR